MGLRLRFRLAAHKLINFGFELVSDALDRFFSPLVPETSEEVPERKMFTHLKGEKLTEYECASFYKDVCPDCLGMIVEGPSGGGSQNYYCTESDCGSKFNDSLDIERISDASPLSLSREGG